MSNVRQIRKKQKSGLGRILIFVIMILAIILIFMTNTLKIEAVIVKGASHYSTQEIKEALGIQEDSNILELYFNPEIDYESYPYIENIEIDYGDYKIITVSVEEKKIMGYLPYMSKYLCIDKDGYIVDYTDLLDENITIIEGVAVESFSIGDKIAVSDELINSWLMFYQAEKQYGVEIDKIILENGDLNQIILYVDDLEIIFGSIDDFSNKFQYLSNSLPSIMDSSNSTFDLVNRVLK